MKSKWYNPYRTKSYIGTFTNDAQGKEAYRVAKCVLRSQVSGGRFVKMFRNGTRYSCVRHHATTNKPYRYWAGTTLNDGTYFDVYFLKKDNMPAKLKNERIFMIPRNDDERW